jgi:hypothetical protein
MAKIEDKSSCIFGNRIDSKTIGKGLKDKEKYLKKFGDDTKKIYHLKGEEVAFLKPLSITNLVSGDEKMSFDPKGIVIGNIRMGFGHYRISLAMASCAQALGYKPYWLDLASFEATGSKMIRYQNELYSKASKISQNSKLFDKTVWEPLNSEGFRKLTYNSTDQKTTELLVPLFADLPKDIPYIATHAWPAQGAIHAGLTHVVDAIPDNWPMALHLAEGSIHTVQTPFAYLGYKMLNGMAKTPLLGMKEEELKEVGCYVDHELVSNIPLDNKIRRERLLSSKPVRILMTVGGAGAAGELFLEMVSHLLSYVKQNKAALFLNFGDHLGMYDFLKKSLPELEKNSVKFFDEYEKLTSFVQSMDEKDISGLYLVCNKNIFQAVYSTNLLMRHVDFLITKPSELAYYPVPKVMMRHIGGHEVYGAIHGQEYGDSTFECPDKESMNRMLDRLLSDKEILIHMTYQIEKLKEDGYYDGGYKCVKLAVEGKKAAI